LFAHLDHGWLQNQWHCGKLERLRLRNYNLDMMVQVDGVSRTNRLKTWIKCGFVPYKIYLYLKENDFLAKILSS